MDGWGILCGCRYLLHDRDTKYSAAFRAMIESAHIDKCLSKIIPFGERPLRRAMKDYIAHYHTERNHQGKNHLLLFHRISKTAHDKPVRCRDRLGGLFAVLSSRGSVNWPSGCSFIDTGRCMTGDFSNLTIEQELVF
jgi:putative transposase